MTYIELINRFWELDECWQFSCCETRLYFYLLKTANRLGWEDNWTRSDTKISSDVGVSEKVMKVARNRLVQAGIIEYKQGNGRGNKSIYSVKGSPKGVQNLPPLRNPLRNPLGIPLGDPLGTPLQEKPPTPPKEEYKTENKTKKEPPKGGKKESTPGELFPSAQPEKSKRIVKEIIAPTLDEVIQYFVSQNAPERLEDWQEQAEIFFNHFDSIGWKNASGVKIERWESKANLWLLDHIKANRKKNETDTQERDSDSNRQKLDVTRNLEELDRKWREEHGIEQEPG
ncbi:hypothetical protein [Bacteroides sp.]|uniref:hypothetical protein n=1 Tax=Bacteroides sp. TaxID=29523 RepID=UPI00262D6748|nr:hypothetical protein [Bacteroides sp.]MDD3038863.1 hypothetical protein [Bacteroides sp.]